MSLVHKRIDSVDVFRGITIAAMILVNNPGTWSQIYAPLRHAPWHGLTPTDLIFPFFLFIVGMSISFAYSKKKTSNIEISTYKKISIRSLKLIGLGLFLAGFTVSFPFFKNLTQLRIPGVLQRIGVVFFITSILFLHTNWKTLIFIFISILIGYWYVMTKIEIDGIVPLLTENSNLASKVDLTILTENHMWKKLHDPEGILSTFPAIATTIFGILMGLILLNNTFEAIKKLQLLFLIGGISLIIGYTWSSNFPINKALWTSSYVLVTGGWACVIYGIIYYFTDILGYKKIGKPAIVFGSNAITVFFLSGFIAKTFYLLKLANGKSVHSYLYGILEDFISIPKLSSLLYAFLVILFYYMIATILYKKKIFIKV